MTKFDFPLEVDHNGKEHSSSDPLYYFIMDQGGRVLCDTLNCDGLDLEEQKEFMDKLASAWNKQNGWKFSDTEWVKT